MRAAFLTAEAVSFTGNKMTMLALPWLVLTTTGSATKVGLVAFAQTGAYVLVKATGAPLIDRLGRKACAVGGGSASALLLVVITLSGQWGLVALLGAVQSLSDAAKRVMLPDLPGPLERTTSLYTGIERLSFLLGAPAAGLMIAAMGPVNVLLIDAGACLVAAALIAVAVSIRSASRTRDPYLTALRDGMRYVQRDRFLVFVCALFLLTNLIDQAMMAVFMPTWAKDVLGSATALGLIVGTYGAGAVLGSALFAWIGPKLAPFWTFAIALLLAGSPPLFALALSNSLTIVLVVGFAAGLLAAAINPIITTAIFRRVPEELHARVFGFTGSLAWAGIPLGGLLAGIMVDAHGLTTALLLAGTAYLLVTVIPLVFSGRLVGELSR